MLRRLPIIAMAMLLIAGIWGSVLAQSPEENKAIVERYFELWKTGDLAIADEIFAIDFVNHDLLFPNVTDLESYKAYVVQVHSLGLSDIHFTMHDIVAQGDKVAYRYTADYIIADGMQVTVTAINIDRFAGGKIVEEWWSADGLGQRQQWGLIPPDREDYGWNEPSEVTGDPGDPETNKANVQRLMDEAFKGNLAVIDELCAADYVMHDPASPMEVRGPEGYKQVMATYAAGFPDMQITLDDLIAEGDKVAYRWTFAGTHTGDFMDIPATGQRIVMTGISIYRFADGKIVEAWASYDALGMLQQLGAIPIEVMPRQCFTWECVTSVESRTWGQVKALFQE